MSRTSGRWATHSSLSCCSAAVRWTLSGDWRPCSRLARAVWTSGGRTDMAREGRGDGGRRPVDVAARGPSRSRQGSAGGGAGGGRGAARAGRWRRGARRGAWRAMQRVEGKQAVRRGEARRGRVLQAARVGGAVAVEISGKSSGAGGCCSPAKTLCTLENVTTGVRVDSDARQPPLAGGSLGRRREGRQSMPRSLEDARRLFPLCCVCDAVQRTGHGLMRQSTATAPPLLPAALLPAALLHCLHCTALHCTSQHCTQPAMHLLAAWHRCSTSVQTKKRAAREDPCMSGAVRQTLSVQTIAG